MFHLAKRAKAMNDDHVNIPIMIIIIIFLNTSMFDVTIMGYCDKLLTVCAQRKSIISVSTVRMRR